MGMVCCVGVLTPRLSHVWCHCDRHERLAVNRTLCDTLSTQNFSACVCRTRRQRSRSPASAPVTHNRLATARRVPTAAAGATAGVFQDAIRRAAPATDLQIKQELFAAGPPVATGGHAGALDREAKIEAFGGPAASAAANGVVHNGAYVATGVPAPPVDPESVVIMNVHYDATPEQLGVFFHERCGGVVRVTILKNAHGMPKGYAYMQLASADAALQAQDISGTDFMSRQLRVRFDVVHLRRTFEHNLFDPKNRSRISGRRHS